MSSLIKSMALGLSFLFVAIAGHLQAANLYAIIVGDTNAYDMRPFVEQDVRLMREEMQNVAHYTGLTLQEMVFVDENAKGSFIQQIERLEIKNDDVVVFYWNGHGVKADDNKRGWPALVKTSESRILDQEQVTELLIKKNPRFLLSIAASCNSIDKELKLSKQERVLSGVEINEETKTKNYRKLFLEITGVVMATSSSAGEYSWVNIEEGGEFYTLALLGKIHRAVEEDRNIAWNTILDRATAEVQEVQTPHYEIIKINRV